MVIGLGPGSGLASAVIHARSYTIRTCVCTYRYVCVMYVQVRVRLGPPHPLNLTPSGNSCFFFEFFEFLKFFVVVWGGYRVRVRVRVGERGHTCVYVYMHVYVHIDTCLNVRVSMCTCVDVCVCVCVGGWVVLYCTVLYCIISVHQVLQ